jgi:hypothetical protein
LSSGERFDESRLRAEHYRLGRERPRGAGKGEVQQSTQDDAPGAILGLDGRRLHCGCAPADLLCLLEHRLEQLRTAECGLPSRLLERKDRGTHLVPEARQEVRALLIGQLLTELTATTGDRQPATLGPADEAAVEGEGLPWSTWWRKIEVRGPVAPAPWHGFHPPAHPDPHGTWRGWAFFDRVYRHGRALDFLLE